MPPSAAPAASIRVVIATDGKRGHENQSRVLARMLGDSEPLLMQLRNPEGGLPEHLLRAQYALLGRSAVAKRRQPRLVQKLLRPEPADAFRSLADEVKAFDGALRIAVVSTGTPPATFNLLLSQLLGAPAVCNMTPSLLPRRLFDLCIVPEHDATDSRQPSELNLVLTPIALSHHDVAAAQFQVRQFVSEAELAPGGRYWAVALGGPSRSVGWEDALVALQLTELVTAAEKAGARLLVTTSRRTTEPVRRCLTELRAAGPQIAYFLDAAVDERNPLPAFCELAEAAIVTGDSYSMVSELIQTGHRPLVLPTAPPEGRKLERSLARMEAQGLLVLGGQSAQPPITAAEQREPNRYYGQLRTAVRRALGLEG